MIAASFWLMAASPEGKKSTWATAATFVAAAPVHGAVSDSVNVPPVTAATLWMVIT